MKTRLGIIFGLLIAMPAMLAAQDFGDVEKSYDVLTEQWLRISTDMKTYQGLSLYCRQPAVQEGTHKLLHTIHYFDSVILETLNDPSMQFDGREQKKTVKDIEKFESEYTLAAFQEVFDTSCKTRRALEKDKEDLTKEIGMYSYDGQVMMLETQLHRYLNHIDKKVVAIDEHLHLLKPHHVAQIQSLMFTGQ